MEGADQRNNWQEDEEFTVLGPDAWHLFVLKVIVIRGKNACVLHAFIGVNRTFHGRQDCLQEDSKGNEHRHALTW